MTVLASLRRFWELDARVVLHRMVVLMFSDTTRRVLAIILAVAMVGSLAAGLIVTAVG